MYPDFATIKQFNDWGISQDLDWYCKYKFITPDQYTELTGKDYSTGKKVETKDDTNKDVEDSNDIKEK